MLSLKQKQSGFTIVELLIVIVIIGILAGLVITTFVGIQARGRDSERQTDIKAVQGQLEAFFAVNGYYPTITNLNSSTWRSANDVKLDPAALKDPNQAQTGTDSATYPLGGSVSDTQYGYVTTGCTSPDVECDTYVLTANKEVDNGTFEVRNQ